MFLDQPVLPCLRLIREAGFSRIEMGAAPLHFNYRDGALVERVLAELTSLGLRLTSLHAPFGEPADLTQPEEPARRAAVGEVTAAADALAHLGGGTLVVHAGSEDAAACRDVLSRLKQSVRSLDEVYEHCQRIGVNLAVEDMLAHLVGGGTQEVQWIAAQFAFRSLGICLDTGHSFLSGELLKRARLFGPRLVLVHAHDNRGRYDEHLPPGEGGIEWPPLLDALAELGLQGAFVLEIHPGAEPGVILRRALRSVRYLQGCGASKGCHLVLQ